MAGHNLDDPPPWVTMTYLGGLFNGEQARVPMPKGAVVIRRAELMRREHLSLGTPGPMVFHDESYHLSEVAPGWWIAVHESIKRGAL